jgi:hypothetical protein
VKCFLITLLILITPTISLAEFGQSSGNLEGVGYLAKADGIKIYEHSEGDAVSATVNKDFPFVAFQSSNALLGIMSSESITSGRAHVRYLKNGQNGKDGENTAWVNLKDVERFQFDCCGDNGHCSGITAPLFKTGSYTYCFTQAMAASIEKRTTTARKGATEATEPEKSRTCGDIELEKLKLQLEIEKLKLEQERLKAGVK